MDPIGPVRGRHDAQMDHVTGAYSEAMQERLQPREALLASGRGIRKLRLRDPARWVVFRPIPTVALRTHVPFDDRQPTEQTLAPSAGARGHGHGPGVRNAG